MLGWSRLSRADGEESDVNLLSADELSSPTNDTEAADHPLVDASVAALPSDHAPPPPTAGTPSPGTRDSNRYRHRSRRHRHHGSRQRLCRFKRKESNFLTAISCMFVVVLVCTSLAEPHWFYFSGGKCADFRGQPINYLGIKLFFYPGSFRTLHNFPSTNVYQYGSASDEVLVNCVTPPLVFVMRSIIALCFLTILFSLVAFILHLVGPTHRVFRSLRSNGIFSIISVTICIIINGLSYLVVEQLTNHFQANLFHEGSWVDVEFSLGFYMITAAGAMSIIGVACNLLRRPTSHDRIREPRDVRPTYDYIATEPPHPSACSQLAPPPYTP